MDRSTTAQKIEDSLRELVDATAERPEDPQEDPASRLRRALDEIAAVGHRINNPLTAVVGRSQLLRMQEDADPRVVRSALLIAESAERIADNVRDLSRMVQTAREALGALQPSRDGQAPAARAVGRR